MANEIESLRARWGLLAQRLGRGSAADVLFDVLEALYHYPPRAYHNLGHVHACLTLLDRQREHAERPDLVELALWVHDCVYAPGRSDNEARSARIGQSLGRELGLGEADIRLVTGWVLATRHSVDPAPGDEALLVDIDMAILAADEGDYDRYVAGIRSEFSFASDEQFRAGRGSFLRALLAKPRIYYSAAMHDALEGRARANVGRELRALS